jgi:nucleotide-binding universal stress UspA family protein
MKIMVCTDGSEQSSKAMEEAVKIAGGCNVDEVSVIHVFQRNKNFPVWDEGYHITQEDIERLRKLDEHAREKADKLVSSAVEFFTSEGIKANGIVREGHPAETIAREAEEGGYDMLVVGSRGLGGLKKLFLGSVSNALLQETAANVLVVKK